MTKIIIDGNYALHKSFSVFRTFTYKGKFTGTSYGILRDIFLLAEKFNSNDIHITWDSRSFRKELSVDYKSTRNIDPKNNPYDSWEDVFELLKACGFNQYKEEGYEADDLIYTLSKGEGDKIIYTKDRDMFQCLSENTSVIRSLKEEPYTINSFSEEYGFNFSAKDFIFYKSVIGDGSDNIKGIGRFPKKELVSFIKKESIKDKWMEMLIDNHSLLEKNKEIFILHEVQIKNPIKTEKDLVKLNELKNKLGIFKLFETKGANICGLKKNE
jgi:DNA polymerase-1